MQSLRIQEHPVLKFPERKLVKFFFDDRAYEGYEGEPIAAALHAAGVRTLRRSPQKNRARGFFCAIGRCSSCIMEVDGQVNIMTCITPLKEGMKIRMQKGHGVIHP
ncbi:MAG TPA: (2Fe-2S)-binding protein [Candidatus Rifleibacterium sp.]|jgi:predicted molibdopterin-dependent oxidoreductase YjgC|nr:(2Fe-2S)-binding protein [Candidatus Rifleibacterium sp.]HOI91118.1 (2Fe-2S)-binding protein [Candidatus Rifleibacterium sp.]HQB84276.1 (2Fe-2S)-binding protein [Candidatus Rifleibacterium sp.]